ncbi:MAG: hypothetical protein AB7P37_19340 [Ramlibacter sp.]
MRALLCLCALAGCAAVQAQPPSTGTAPATLQRDTQTAGRHNQRIERVRIEDAGSRVDELRYGGESQSITVQPKADVPEYQVQRDGTRVWNVLKF